MPTYRAPGSGLAALSSFCNRGPKLSLDRFVYRS